MTKTRGTDYGEIIFEQLVELMNARDDNTLEQAIDISGILDDVSEEREEKKVEKEVQKEINQLEKKAQNEGDRSLVWHHKGDQGFYSQCLKDVQKMLKLKSAQTLMKSDKAFGPKVNSLKENLTLAIIACTEKGAKAINNNANSITKDQAIKLLNQRQITYRKLKDQIIDLEQQIVIARKQLRSRKR